MTGSAGGSDCAMVDVFPNSSLETPASEDVGISVQRHGNHMSERQSMAATGLVSTVDARIKCVTS
jgi:hypothetical protein